MLLLKIWHLIVFGNKIQLFFGLFHSNSLLGWAGVQLQAVCGKNCLHDWFYNDGRSLKIRQYATLYF